tara:strand:- start:564 stop:1367 length:804 start_codon:yes stop_codon:yes gene_type:complete
MKYLRQYIRNTLLEAPEEHHELINQANQKYNELISQQKRKIADGDWEYDSRIEHAQMIKYPQLKNARRNIKRVWNELADHSYWQNPNNIVCCHSLSFINEGSLNEYFGPNGFYDLHNKNRDELSCVGMFGLSDGDIKRLHNHAGSLFITLSPRRVTFAYAGDAYTEELHWADEEVQKFHKSSGLPKRPGRIMALPWRSKVLLDREDIEKAEKHPSAGLELRKKKWIGEVIIDNWKLDTVYIAKYKKIKDMHKNIQFCEDNNIKYKVI